MELNTAVERAVSESIQEGILKEFLQKNRAEVVAMSIFEYNEEEEKRKLRKAEYEAGKNDGIKIGREEEKRKIAIRRGRFCSRQRIRELQRHCAVITRHFLVQRRKDFCQSLNVLFIPT